MLLRCLAISAGYGGSWAYRQRCRRSTGGSIAPSKAVHEGVDEVRNASINVTAISKETCPFQAVVSSVLLAICGSAVCFEGPESRLLRQTENARSRDLNYEEHMKSSETFPVSIATRTSFGLRRDVKQ